MHPFCILFKLVVARPRSDCTWSHSDRCPHGALAPPQNDTVGGYRQLSWYHKSLQSRLGLHGLPASPNARWQSSPGVNSNEGLCLRPGVRSDSSQAILWEESHTTGSVACCWLARQSFDLASHLQLA